MAEGKDASDFVGLAEFLVSLVEETAEAVRRAQLVQSEDEGDLRAAAELEVEAAAERLVTIEAAQMVRDQLLAESGADSDWPGRSTAFVRLVEERLGIALTPEADYDRRGLKAAGAEKVVAAARGSIAADQLQLARRLLSEGTQRVKIASGTIGIKVEMRPEKARQEPLRSSRLPGTIRGRDGTAPGLRIVVRPAQREDGGAAGVFGEIAINFTVV